MRQSGLQREKARHSFTDGENCVMITIKEAGEDMKRVLVAMSGGVDSSVTAWLLQREGYDCAGATMRLYRSTDLGEACHKTCCSETDAEDAGDVAFRLGIPFEVLD